MVNAALGFVVFFVFYIISIGIPPLASLLIPVLLIPLLLFTVGLVWFLCSLGVFLRDIQHMVAVAISLLLFLSPIFYPLSALPPSAQALAAWSPIAVVVEACRSVLFGGTIANPTHLAIAFLMGIASFIGGSWWFANTRRGFADVL